MFSSPTPSTLRISLDPPGLDPSTTPVLLPGKSHGLKSLVGYSPWGRKQSDTTEQLHFHFSFSCTGEGNGNPLHMLAWRIPGKGAWWAAVYGVTQSRTRLTWLSSSCSDLLAMPCFFFFGDFGLFIAAHVVPVKSNCFNGPSAMWWWSVWRRGMFYSSVIRTQSFSEVMPLEFEFHDNFSVIFSPSHFVGQDG